MSSIFEKIADWLKASSEREKKRLDKAREDEIAERELRAIESQTLK